MSEGLSKLYGNALTSDDMYLAMCDSDSLSIAMAKGDQQSILLYFQQTQKEFIKKRPKRGGGQVNYIEGWYVKQILNLATKFQWSSFIDGSLRDGDFIIVWGRVEITINYQKYTQSAYGRNEIKYLKQTPEQVKANVPRQPVDLGDAYKSAHTDMIKKAANNWGIAMDVYSGRDLE